MVTNGAPQLCTQKAKRGGKGGSLPHFIKKTKLFCWGRGCEDHAYNHKTMTEKFGNGKIWELNFSGTKIIGN